MRINREHLLQILESVSVGVSRTKSFDQSTCFAFDGGRVYGFNGDMACSNVSPLNGVCGAVQAETLMELLRKLPEDELDVSSDKGVLKIQGRGRRAKFAMEGEITLPVGAIETPGEWSPLHDEFCEAAGMAADCAGKDETKFETTCVHVHPKYLESFDGSQLLRHKLKTGFREQFLIQKASMKQICVMGMTHVSLTPKWAHFKNSDDYVLSCLRFHELEFYDLSQALELVGEPLSLPKGLAQTAELAELCSKESLDDNVLTVTLRPGEVLIEGRGVTSSYEEKKRVNYSGPELTFCIAPSLLAVLAEKYNEARVTRERLIVDGGKWRYVVMLKLPEG